MKPSIGIIKEGKVPVDARVALTPQQCQSLVAIGWSIAVESCPYRCYNDQEYIELEISVVKDVSDADILVGIKEVPIPQLKEGKTYFFFSHTIKKQEHNRDLLKSILQKNIQLIDYEVLVDNNNERLIAFGRFAGMVGAHNGLWTFGKRSHLFDLPRMNSVQHYTEMLPIYKSIEWPALKIVLTGKGRVGQGAAEVLLDMGFKKVDPVAFLSQTYNYPVFTQIGSEDYVQRIDGQPVKKQDYYAHPEDFKMDFYKYLKVADIFINGIYWDDRSPAFFELKDISRKDFKTQVIADVTCDIAPKSSIPLTIRASTILDPVFGIDKSTFEETEAFQANSVDLMSIDNLPNELPRDASEAFGEKFIETILPELLKSESDVIDKASITIKGHLNSHFEYLADYVS